MGLFDWVITQCPACGQDCELQSKGGDPYQRTWDFTTAPPEVLADMNGDTHKCGRCGAKFAIEVQVTAKTVLARAEGRE